MLAKFNNLNESLANKKLEELRAWKKRSDNLRKTISTLEEKITDLTNRNIELTKFQGQKDEMQEEELKMLREETKKSDSFWTAKKLEWDGDKKMLIDEVKILREKAKIAENTYGQMKDLMKTKADLLEEKITHIEIMERAYFSV
jgi:hypothetical protein